MLGAERQEVVVAVGRVREDATAAGDVGVDGGLERLNRTPQLLGPLLVVLVPLTKLAHLVLQRADPFQLTKLTLLSGDSVLGSLAFQPQLLLLLWLQAGKACEDGKS